MTLKRIMPIALGFAMIAVASVQSYAFMLATEEGAVEAQLDVVTMIEELQAEIDSETTCEEKLIQVDAALEQVDSVLDQGVDNEDTLLVAREAIIEMRLGLPCRVQEQQLAGSHNSSCGCQQCNTGGGVLGGGGGGILGGGGVISNGGGGVFSGGGAFSGGGGAFSGGGGALLGGGGSIGGFGLLAGGAAAIVAIAASSDDDDPGTPATNAAN